MNNSKLHHKKSFVPNAFKFLIAMSAMAGTIGIWNLISNKDLIQAYAQNLENTQLVPPVTLEPLPTLVALKTVDANIIIAGSTMVPPTVPLSNLPNVDVPRPGNQPQIGLPNQAQAIQNAPAVAPAPVTTTRSS